MDRVNPEVRTNTIEVSSSIYKRCMRGFYQDCAKTHLHRYLAQFDFCYSNRAILGYNVINHADVLLRGIVGKRLIYEMIGVQR
ncbi:MAG: hypothetical protein WCL10_19460 [Novosphingobium sp.]|uniref:hypothetical protein n=1 Tax=Novosphingobium sp. TaxID=1874826 RepID=UPI00301937CD